MVIFSVVANVVLVVATLVVIWYARDTVKESHKATKATRDTVDALRELLAVAQATAASSETAAAAARDTVEVARASREADALCVNLS